MRRSLFVFPVLALASCAPVQQAVKVPQVHVDGIRLNSLSLPSGLRPAVANVTLHLKVGNPNGVGVRLANIAGTLVIDGAQVGHVNLPNVNLPAGGETLQDANLDIPVTLNTASSFLKVALGQQVSYRLDGAFTADLGLLGHPTFGPFTLSQGVWKQPAILPF
ncbi:LEA type 2 family protein [Deinococcus sp.]|uniref:LEA type 2 family protein n=1 Tax=Deinococcus sp. TaxID=47478 RepID=UPI0025BD4A25|nr:LEA type 2 family protein [Deinococcus sp.]